MRIFFIIYHILILFNFFVIVFITIFLQLKKSWLLLFNNSTIVLVLPYFRKSRFVLHVHFSWVNLFKFLYDGEIAFSEH
jgi:hypothetical protein